MAERLLSVVVVTWECADHLEALVDSLNGKLDPGAELVVVDNRSADSPERVARGWHGSLRFEAQERNDGFGRAANRGVELASGEAVVLLNPDTRVLDEGLGSVAGFALANRCLAAPRIVNPDGSVQPSASGPPVGVWPWIGALVPGAVQPKRLLRLTEPWRLEQATPVTWLSAACLAGPRSLLLELGPFDPSIQMYAEDMDLGLRAGQIGVRSWLCPQMARVEHRRRGSTERRWPEGPEEVAAANRRVVIGRAYGPAAERGAWLAERARLRLRALAKRALRRPADAELRELEAQRSAPAPAPADPGGSLRRSA